MGRWEREEWDDELEKFTILRRVCRGIQGFAAFISTLTRMYLFAEAFVGLRAAPKDVYKSAE